VPDSNDEKRFTELGLQKVTAYIPENSVNAKSIDAIAKGPLSSSIPMSGKTDAQRRKLARKRQKELGLTQINVIIQNSTEIREQMSVFAKRLVDLNSWNDAILADPAVRPILAALEHAEIRLGRIDDLEERHRRIYPFIQFHNNLITSHGIRRIFLYLAGVDCSTLVKDIDGER
jgi:hypothetical protein